MEGRSRIVLIAALALTAPAYAQNKCVDEKGKVTYQQDPCPGQVRAPAPAAPTGKNASMQLRIESHDMEMCAGTWDNIAGRLEFSRNQIARAREQGRNPGREEMLATQDRQNMMAQFLPGCAKYGFQDARDPQAEQRNSAVAKELMRKIEANGAEIEAIGQRDIAAREAASRARQASERERETRRECDMARKQIGDARAQISRYSGRDRVEGERQIAKAEQDLAKTCPPG